MASAPPLEGWTGEGVSIAEIERTLARLRADSAHAGGTDLRTSVMTHVAWVPAEWKQAALDTLAGLAERHPSRAIVLLPDPDADVDRLDADLSLQCFPLHEQEQHVCSEVIVLHLRGGMCRSPASIVQPLLITSLPFFLRWRGRPPFGDEAFEELVGLVDRFIVDSVEWPDVPASYAELAERFERTAVSDIAWSRGLPWRRALADRWPGIAEIRELRVAGPRADACLLAGWLRSRLERDVELAHEAAVQLERVAVDGEELDPPAAGPRDASDLLSEELDRFGRDPIYEDAARAAAQRKTLGAAERRRVRFVFGLYVVFTVSLLVLYLGIGLTARQPVRRFLFENLLSVFFGTLFLAALVGQSIAGQRVFNEEERAHGGEPASWLGYVLSSDFGQAVMENWQS